MIEIKGPCLHLQLSVLNLLANLCQEIKNTIFTLTKNKNWKYSKHLHSNIFIKSKEKYRKIFSMWNVSKYGVISGPYFSAFRLNTERYEVYICIYSKCRTMWTRKNSLFGIFSESKFLNSYFETKWCQQRRSVRLRYKNNHYISLSK